MKGLAAAAAVAVLLAAGAALATGTDDELAPGPMVKPNAHVWGHHVRTGVPFTDGFEKIVIKGDKPAVLESIAMDADPELKVLGYKLVGPDRSYGGIQVMKGWPPRDRFHEAEHVIDAFTTELQTWDQLDGRGYELLIGYQVDEEGYFVRKGFWVTYTVEGERFRQYFPAVLAVCNGVQENQRDCAAPEDWARYPEHKDL